MPSTPPVTRIPNPCLDIRANSSLVSFSASQPALLHPLPLFTSGSLFFPCSPPGVTHNSYILKILTGTGGKSLLSKFSCFKVNCVHKNFTQRKIFAREWTLDPSHLAFGGWGTGLGVEEILVEGSVLRHGSSEIPSRPLNHCFQWLTTGLLPAGHPNWSVLGKQKAKW